MERGVLVNAHSDYIHFSSKKKQVQTSFDLDLPQTFDLYMYASLVVVNVTIDANWAVDSIWHEQCRLWNTNDIVNLIVEHVHQTKSLQSIEQLSCYVELDSNLAWYIYIRIGDLNCQQSFGNGKTNRVKSWNDFLLTYSVKLSIYVPYTDQWMGEGESQCNFNLRSLSCYRLDAMLNEWVNRAPTEPNRTEPISIDGISTNLHKSTCRWTCIRKNDSHYLLACNWDLRLLYNQASVADYSNKRSCQLTRNERVRKESKRECKQIVNPFITNGGLT